MIQLPVRIELRVRSPDESTCSFTIQHNFVLPPSQGDHIIFESGLYVTVSQCFHYTGLAEEPSLLVITSPHAVGKYDELLRALDWFKSNADVQDISAKQKPAPYYSFYRSVLRLLEWSDKTDPKLTYEEHMIKLFGEACRTVLISEYLLDVAVTKDAVNQHFGQYSDTILSLTRLVLERKTSEPNGTDILDLIKQWEPLINPDASIGWSADLEVCQQVGHVVFSRVHSIPNDALPKFLRNG